MKEKELENQENEEIFDVNDGADQYEDDGIEPSAQRKYVIYAALAAGAVLLLVGGWFGWNYMQEKAQAEASLKLARIRPYYDQGYYNEALNGLGGAVMRGERVVGLRAIADEYSNSETGKLAALYTASVLSATGDVGGAARYFDQASGASAVITRVGGLAGAASCKAQGNNSAEAAKMYEQAAEEAEKIGEGDRYRLFAAMHYEKAGNKESALKLYKHIAASPETMNEAVVEAKSGVVRLGGTL
jgi:predicted negative regulator of RcsB-dependent stress response